MNGRCVRCGSKFQAEDQRMEEERKRGLLMQYLLQMIHGLLRKLNLGSSFEDNILELGEDIVEFLKRSLLGHFWTMRTWRGSPISGREKQRVIYHIARGSCTSLDRCQTRKP